MGSISQVSDRLYRGPQPTGNIWSELQDLGVLTSIKLNRDSEGSDDDAAKYGIAVLKHPMPPSSLIDLLEDPGDAAVLGALEAMGMAGAERSDVFRPVYVHCTHGHDRTGLLVGLHRLRTGWGRAAAHNEMRAMGFHEGLIGLDLAWRRLGMSPLP